MFASTDAQTLRARALDAADRIGARLVRDAVRADRRATWFGDTMEPINGQWTVALKTSGPDVYGGTPGIAMFLARLHHATSEKLFAQTADAAFEHALAALDSVPLEGRGSLWSGWAGAAWALLDAGEVLGRAGYIERGLQLAEAVSRLDPTPGATDVMSGGAGLIPFLLRVHLRYGCPWAADAALRHGSALVGSAQRSSEGCSWATMPVMEGHENRHLTGYSHGASGIGLALLELAKLTGERTFRDTADRAMAYEQRWFSPRHGNWPDFREMRLNTPESQWPYSVAWCHGAPGIALARLRAWQLTEEPAYREQATIALRTTAAAVGATAPGSGAWCLCHGTAGNADVLLAGASILGEPAWRQAAEQAALRGIDTYENADLPWPPGVNGGVENPSLMLGSAGVGWFLLRVAQPDVPSVLFFA